MDVKDLKELNAEVKRRMDGALEHIRREMAGVRIHSGALTGPRRVAAGRGGGLPACAGAGVVAAQVVSEASARVRAAAWARGELRRGAVRRCLKPMNVLCGGEMLQAPAR